MKLSQFKNHLKNISQLTFTEPSGNDVPAHFHITEVGVTTKHFIDCGGTVRTEKFVSFQLWTANDVEHRLAPTKLAGIISKAEPILGEEDFEVEIEYQSQTIGRYGVDFNGENFVLQSKQTDCLAKDQCGIPQDKQKLALAELSAPAACCAPGSGCC